jgi:outer membrane receptor for ferrienterochelin and colicin
VNWISTSRLNIVFCVLVAYVFGSDAYAQYSNGQVQGMVLEQDDKGKLSALPGVHVYWLGTEKGTVTDTLGRFSIARDSASKRLVFTYIGYRADTLLMDKDPVLRIVLKQAHVLESVGIEYKQKGTEVSLLDLQLTRSMTEKELFKAACCNLSESFETNPSVDVAFSDAVTGTRQIQLLGLSGTYIQTTRENMPGIRGLYAQNGFGYLPGTWIEGIQVSKGTGSVVNGFESMTGQINVELHKPQTADAVYLNGYANESGRLESNLVTGFKMNPKWSGVLMLHADQRPWEVDQNGDRFLDMPRGGQYSALGKIHFVDLVRGLESQTGVMLLEDRKQSGQLGFRRNQPRLANLPYGVTVDAGQWSVWNKTGFVFPGSRYKSAGLQLSYTRHSQQGQYGLRSYNAVQQSGYANFIYQSIVGNTNHTIRMGASSQWDQVQDRLDSLHYQRLEWIPGLFTEYTFAPVASFSVVAGLRYDQHSMFGGFFTPRLHARWAVKPSTVLRLSAGRGQRTPNVIMDNEALLISSRNWQLPNRTSRNNAIGFKPEISWNAGISAQQRFTLDYREGNISTEVFYTSFIQQVVVDVDAQPTNVLLYPLAGSSTAFAWQAEGEYALSKRLDIRIAYRYYDVQTDFVDARRSRPWVVNHKAFANLAFESRRKQWLADVTVQWTGSRRLPLTDSSPELFRQRRRSPSFVQVHAQVTRQWGKKWALYLGVENLTNFTQENPIVGATNPFDSFFDSTFVWGPIFGRMLYAGFRFRIAQRAEKAERS